MTTTASAICRPTTRPSPEPYCSDAGCSQCPGGVCPSGFCSTDAQCANGTICDLASSPPSYTCKCADSSQCSGLWPVCLDIETNDAGLTSALRLRRQQRMWGRRPDLGSAAPAFAGQLAQCGIPCTSPEFPAWLKPLPASRQSATRRRGPAPPAPATTSAETRTTRPVHAATVPRKADSAPAAVQRIPTARPARPVSSMAARSEPAQRHSPAARPRAAPRAFCNWDSGVCMSGGTGTSLCLTDFDCAIDSYAGATCLAGKCIRVSEQRRLLEFGRRRTGGIGLLPARRRRLSSDRLQQQHVRRRLCRRCRLQRQLLRQ